MSMAERGSMTAIRRSPLELKRLGPAECERSLYRTVYHPIRSLPLRREFSIVVPGARRTVRGSVMACSAIAALVSSRPPVVMLCRRVLARPIRLWLCNTPYANMVVSLKSPTHHTANSVSSFVQWFCQLVCVVLI